MGVLASSFAGLKSGLRQAYSLENFPSGLALSTWFPIVFRLYVDCISMSYAWIAGFPDPLRGFYQADSIDETKSQPNVPGSPQVVAQTRVPY